MEYQCESDGFFIFPSNDKLVCSEQTGGDLLPRITCYFSPIAKARLWKLQALFLTKQGSQCRIKYIACIYSSYSLCTFCITRCLMGNYNSSRYLALKSAEAISSKLSTNSEAKIPGGSTWTSRAGASRFLLRTRKFAAVYYILIQYKNTTPDDKAKIMRLRQ